MEIAAAHNNQFPQNNKVQVVPKPVNIGAALAYLNLLLLILSPDLGSAQYTESSLTAQHNICDGAEIPVSPTTSCLPQSAQQPEAVMAPAAATRLAASLLSDLRSTTGNRISAATTVTIIRYKVSKKSLRKETLRGMSESETLEASVINYYSIFLLMKFSLSITRQRFGWNQSSPRPGWEEASQTWSFPTVFNSTSRGR